MERLSFNFYRALYVQIEMYESLFSQLQRDYDRESEGKALVFAVDFSELHRYAHSVNRDSRRSAASTYILNNLDDQFTILPGAVGELLADLAKGVPRHLKEDFAKALHSSPSVAEFLACFTQGIQDEEHLSRLYIAAESDLRSLLGDVIDILVAGRMSSSLEALQELLHNGKIRPVDGVQQVIQISVEDKNRARLVQTYLTVDRPERPENNIVDAVDFLFALLLNRQYPNERYVTIFSQAASMVRACKSHSSLQWQEDYLIREAEYLQVRTRIQRDFANLTQRHKYAAESRKLAQELKRAITRLVDVDQELQEDKTVTPSLKMIDLYRRFDEECVQLLLPRSEPPETATATERVQTLYRILKDEGEFVGRAEEAYSVLKEHLKGINYSLRAFAPRSTDPQDVRAYKASLRQWLKVNDSPTEC